MANEPKNFYTKPGLSLMKNKGLVIAAAVAVGVIMLFLLYQNEASRKNAHIKPASPKAEGNALYSKSEIDALIKDQLSKRESDQKDKYHNADVKTPAGRKLKTAIAVYVKKKEEVKPPAPITAKNKALGVPTGAKIKAHLANAIFSFNVTSPAVAVVDEDFTKDGEVVIPKGTQFIGDAGILKSVDRINVRFSVMVLPGGKEVKVNTMALSLDGSGGIKGKVDKQDDKSIFKALGETALAAGAVVLGNTNSALSLNDQLRLNAARNLSDDARGALNQVKIEESISVEAYTPILVLFLSPL